MSDPRTFDLFAPEQGVKYAQASVKVVRDRQALYDHIKLNDRLNAARGLDADAVQAMESELNELAKRAEKSAYTIVLQGISPDTAQEMRERIKREQFPDVDEDNDEFGEAYNTALLEAMLVSITDADGAIAKLPTGLQVVKWFNGLPKEAKHDLLIAIAELTFEAMRLSVEVNNPDF